MIARRSPPRAASSRASVPALNFVTATTSRPGSIVPTTTFRNTPEFAENCPIGPCKHRRQLQPGETGDNDREQDNSQIVTDSRNIESGEIQPPTTILFAAGSDHELLDIGYESDPRSDAPQFALPHKIHDRRRERKHRRWTAKVVRRRTRGFRRSKPDGNNSHGGQRDQCPAEAPRRSPGGASDTSGLRWRSTRTAAPYETSDPWFAWAAPRNWAARRVAAYRRARISDTRRTGSAEPHDQERDRAYAIVGGQPCRSRTSVMQNSYAVKAIHLVERRRHDDSRRSQKSQPRRRNRNAPSSRRRPGD